jgi:hypothetical protein
MEGIEADMRGKPWPPNLEFARFTSGWGIAASIWLAVAANAAFAAWLLLDLGSIQDSFYANSDNSSALVLAELLDERGSGDAVLGDYFWLETLYALHLTRWLPSYREVWEAAPFAIYALTLALVGWTVARTVSRRMGLVVALAMAAPAPLILEYVTSPNAHAHSLVHAVILAAFLITSPRIAAWGRTSTALWTVGLAVTLAPGAASDPIFLIGGVGPFLLAVVVGWRLRLLSRGIAILAATASLVGTGAGLLLAEIAKEDGIRPSGLSFPLASPDHAFDNVQRLVEAVALFVHGRLGDAAIPGNASIPDGFDRILVIGTAVALPILGIAVIRSAPSLLRDPGRSAGQRLLFIYWGVAVAALAAAFIGSSAPVDIGSARYLLIAWPALLTLAAIVFGRRALTGLALLAATTGVLGCIELARDGYRLPIEYSNEDVVRLQRFIDANRLDHGYSSYEYAAAITRLTDFDVRLYPVADCGRGDDKRCPSLEHQMDAWYEGKPGVRTFYVFNPTTTFRAIGPPPTRWGEPAEVARIGPFQLFVYDFDLATVLRSGKVDIERG